MRALYIEQCLRLLQDQIGKTPSLYTFFKEGTPVTKEHRQWVRSNPFLEQEFPEPLGKDTDAFLQRYKVAKLIERFPETAKLIERFLRHQPRIKPILKNLLLRTI